MYAGTMTSQPQFQILRRPINEVNPGDVVLAVNDPFAPLDRPLVVESRYHASGKFPGQTVIEDEDERSLLFPNDQSLTVVVYE